jgi:hypothetical protein
MRIAGVTRSRRHLLGDARERPHHETVETSSFGLSDRM